MSALSSPAAAASPQADNHVQGEVGVVSDYRFRGVSQTRGNPAFQGSIDITLEDGWTVGAWTSLTADTRQDTDELDLYAARSGPLGQVEYEVVTYAYIAPAIPGGSYVELQGTLRREFDRGAFEFELSMVPHQGRTVPTNVYAAVRGTMPLLPDGPAILIEAGFEQGMADNKFNWEAGVLGGRGRLQYKLSATGSTARYDSGGSTAAIVVALSHRL